MFRAIVNLFNVILIICGWIAFSYANAQEVSKKPEAYYHDSINSKVQDSIISDDQELIFSAPDLKEKIAQHKLVAIMPFEVQLTFRNAKKLDKDLIEENEFKLGHMIQSSLFTYLLRKGKNFNISFQDVDKTEILLRKFFKTDTISNYSKEKLARYLGVDALIYGKFKSKQTTSDAVSIITSSTLAIFGGSFAGFLGSVNGIGTVNLTLYNSVDGERLWSFNKAMNLYDYSSTSMMVERMMRKISRNFPYEGSEK